MSDANLQTSTVPVIPDGRAGTRGLARVPFWLIAAMILGIIFLAFMLTDADYRVILAAGSKGIGVTIRVSLISYAIALVFGLIIGLGRVSSHRVINEVATFYVEIIRGVPMLVLLYYIVFAGAPGLINAINWSASKCATRVSCPASATAWRP